MKSVEVMDSELSRLSEILAYGLLKEVRIVFLYGIPVALIIFLLGLISWDSSYLVAFFLIYTFCSIIAHEDSETLDEDIKVILVCLTADVGLYSLTVWGRYHLSQKYSTEETTFLEGERRSFLLHAVALLKSYLLCMYHISFFHASTHAVVIAMFLIAKLAAKLSI